MSSPVERLAVVDDNYRQARDNEPADLSRALTESDVAAIMANFANAKLAYFEAVAAALAAGGPAVEAAFAAAKAAQTAVEASRANLEALPTLLGKLKIATSAAGKLVNVAKA